MDLDSDYYSSRCKDIVVFELFKVAFMTFVGGKVIIKRYLILKKKRSCCKCRVEML